MDIRKAYLDFFASKGHEITPSSPLVPDDATLLFANAGMVPFKSIFTGEIPRPNPPRKTSCQTCIRAGGKHNDLDNVGYTARHHTFFEMLGNFSFGDYFKEQAIAYAWEFVTEVLKLPKDRLYVTVHENDDEAFNLWQKHIQKERIYKFGDKDNFWQMGDTGPCGPCSEIFYDQGEEHFNSSEDYMGGDGDRFLEIWNLVFMQYERSADGVLSPLPKPSIDTGMGLERVTAIKEGKFSNFDSSLFMPIINEISKLCNKTYIYESGASFRVIADHIRSSVFLLAQGVSFDKEGRGYVLRRILRRALRHGYLLGFKQAFMYKLVDIVCDLMGGHYTYLNEKKDFIKEQIRLEEERFLSTIENGIEIFNEELKNTKEIFSGEVAFKLYDTYGFPLDLTADMLREKNLKVDEEKFELLMNEQKARAKASWKGSGDKTASGDFKNLLEKFGENHFVGYEKAECESKILALLDEDFKEVSTLKDAGWVMLENTPFYATSGGQSADSGFIAKREVLDTQKFFNLNLSFVKAGEELKVGDIVHARIDTEKREQIARHHSATHLLHHALREILGSHVSQAGSLVESNKLRFDFTHHKALNKEELESIEKRVNEMIINSSEAILENMPLEEAKKSGAIALFNEKYQGNVRVLTLGESKELCGGTHVKNTAQIGSFYIVKESGVSAGVRRIEAVVSKAALEFVKNQLEELSKVKDELKNNDILNGVKKLKNEILSLKNELKNSSKTELDSKNIQGVEICVKRIDNGDIKAMIDDFKNKFAKAVILLIQVKDEKITLAAGVKDAPLKAGALVKEAAQILGGNGGGRDDFATAGGKDLSKINEALKQSLETIEKAL
ncbi:alanine--tRNA ligase [Campylobacter jejuni]|uniref:Alanine--tRNA ligase n=3 Tax=Campylobacterales TaxID=213849 RepID=SYA_CAMJJ|nr:MULTISPECIES: alanine--tRNA ligase [Campylobacter]A1VYL8.1 RecName: Full=Alanine--tRNA ligase; AltName: Full=Alanyl-tRNA synthetase; Short=AlaRS [Campylobacter jejuni subsp. jejuni 81-176]EAK5450590.1 alanine--tRNA ligase [Campylobacter hyointestinalis]ETJ82535.1 alanyl-tRNA synthetase [Campylobacter jejuni subsp. jejuni 81-176-DRH212]ETN89930.1 alanyl-tRNA synthetase [Campylobacter jejuni subsp. jejuni 81-176-UMCW9]ASN49574.1 alanine--tRNA ligase [Campylobacter jejuni]ASQ33298.1 alanine--